MQENNPAPMANSPQTTEVQPVIVANDQQPKTNNFLVILLSILLFISVAIAGFFSFQTQKLVKELAVLKTEDKVVVVATEESTVEPVEIESSEVDPTANWKTYTNSTYKFIIKYPSNWISKNYTPSDSRIPYLYNSDNKYEIQFGYNKDEPKVISEMTGKPMVTDLSDYKLATINGAKVYVNENLQGDDGNYIKYLFQINEGEYISVLSPLTNGPSNVVWDDAAISLAKQILSTFKFTN